MNVHLLIFAHSIGYSIMDITPRQLEILQATAELLSCQGVQSLTIKNVASKTGFGESALYRHFKSKEEILYTMLRYMISNTKTRLETITLEENSPEEKLRIFVQTQVSYFSSNRHFLIAMFSEGLLTENKALNGLVLEMLNTIRPFLLAIMKQGQAMEMFRADVSAENLTMVMMGTMRLQMLQWRLSNFEFDINERSGQMLNVITTLIKI